MFREVRGEAELSDVLNPAMQASVVGNCLRLIVVDIRMAAQLLQGELVDI